MADRTILFKIDYYDRDLLGGSEDPGNPHATCRVMTVMLAEEYSRERDKACGDWRGRRTASFACEGAL